MSFLEWFEKVKRKLGASWLKLLEQLPDLDREDSYYFDPISKTYRLKSVMPQNEVYILDENRNLKVETPNFRSFTGTILAGAPVRNLYIQLDFLADSVTLVFITAGGSNSAYVYYHIDVDDPQNYLEAYSSGNFSATFITQVDVKPFSDFYVTMNTVSGQGIEYQIIFSKQKKTKISDLVYSSNWNGIIDIAPSKNVVYDKFVSIIAQFIALISDTAYNESTWNGVTTIAPSKNAVRDKIESIITAYTDLIDALDYYTQNEVDDLIPLVSEFAHNELADLNAGTVYEHISQAQKDALHSVLTNLIQLTTRNHNDLLNINAGTDYEHITQTQKDALHPQSHDHSGDTLKNYVNAAIQLYDNSAGWYKIGTLSGIGAGFTVIVHGKNYGNQTSSMTIAQFTIGNTDDKFGGAYYSQGQANSGISFEWVKTASLTIDCYISVPSFCRCSAQIIEKHSFTLNATVTSLLGDPSGTDLVNLFHLYCDTTITGDLKLNGDIYSDGILPFFVSGDDNDYIVMQTISNIPHLGVYGTSLLYIHDGTGWDDLHADVFTEHTSPFPKKLCTPDILKIKGKANGKLDKKTLPKEAYYTDVNNEEGMKLGAMVLHLTKTIQELNERIEILENN